MTSLFLKFLGGGLLVLCGGGIGWTSACRKRETARRIAAFERFLQYVLEAIRFRRLPGAAVLAMAARHEEFSSFCSDGITVFSQVKPPDCLEAELAAKYGKVCVRWKQPHSKMPVIPWHTCVSYAAVPVFGPGNPPGMRCSSIPGWAHAWDFWPPLFCPDRLELSDGGNPAMDIDLVFKIAAIGIIVAVLNQLLIRSGREDQAMMTTLAGLIVVLTMLVRQISDLFVLIKALFDL